MKFPILHRFAATPEQVYSALTDADLLGSCIDGCEKMVKTSDDSYETKLKVGIAGMKGSYAGKVKITAKQPPEFLTLAMAGMGGAGFVKATAQLRLASLGSETELTGECDATVGGLIAAVGSRLIEAMAKKMMGEFFVKLAARITARGVS